MNKDVQIKITGTHGSGKDKDTVVTNCSGFYYVKNDQIYLKYTEVDEDTKATRNALVKVHDKTVSVEYKGITDTYMLFEVGKSNNSMYITPLGSMRITITTKTMEIEQKEDYLRIFLDYEMSFDEDKKGDQRAILIEVKNIDK